jgi:hypothetical protein
VSESDSCVSVSGGNVGNGNHGIVLMPAPQKDTGGWKDRPAKSLYIVHTVHSADPPLGTSRSSLLASRSSLLTHLERLPPGDINIEQMHLPVLRHELA